MTDRTDTHRIREREKVPPMNPPLQIQNFDRLDYTTLFDVQQTRGPIIIRVITLTIKIDHVNERIRHIQYFTIIYFWQNLWAQETKKGKIKHKRHNTLFLYASFTGDI